jgi:hypothetical protein
VPHPLESGLKVIEIAEEIIGGLCNCFSTNPPMHRSVQTLATQVTQGLWLPETLHSYNLIGKDTPQNMLLSWV